MSKQSVFWGIVVASVCWWSFWPKKESYQTSGGAVPHEVRKVRGVSDLVSLLGRINDEQNLSTQVGAVKELRDMNNVKLEGMLDSLLPNEESGRLSMAMVALLLEWVGRDPERAVAWAWENLYDSKNWPVAFNEMGPQWAWVDPDGLVVFLKQHLVFGETAVSWQSFPQLQTSKKPVIDVELATEAKGWLRRFSIRAAFQIQRFIGHRRADEELALSLSLASVKECADALSAWDDYDPFLEEEARVRYEQTRQVAGGFGSPENVRRVAASCEYQRVRNPKELKLVQAIIGCWRRVDEEGFERTQYVEWEAEE